MQISKFSILLCALALCGGMTLRAEDNAAQAAARAALMQKMQQLEGNAATAMPFTYCRDWGLSCGELSITYSHSILGSLSREKLRVEFVEPALREVQSNFR